MDLTFLTAFCHSLYKVNMDSAIEASSWGTQSQPGVRHSLVPQPHLQTLCSKSRLLLSHSCLPIMILITVLP